MTWIPFTVLGCAMLLIATLASVIGAAVFSGVRDRQRLFSRGERIGWAAVGTVVTIVLLSFLSILVYITWNLCELAPDIC